MTNKQLLQVKRKELVQKKKKAALQPLVIQQPCVFSSDGIWDIPRKVETTYKKKKAFVSTLKSIEEVKDTLIDHHETSDQTNIQNTSVDAFYSYNEVKMNHSSHLNSYLDENRVDSMSQTLKDPDNNLVINQINPSTQSFTTQKIPIHNTHKMLSRKNVEYVSLKDIASSESVQGMTHHQESPCIPVHIKSLNESLNDDKVQSNTKKGIKQKVTLPKKYKDVEEEFFRSNTANEIIKQKDTSKKETTDVEEGFARSNTVNKIVSPIRTIKHDIQVVAKPKCRRRIRKLLPDSPCPAVEGLGLNLNASSFVYRSPVKKAKDHLSNQRPFVDNQSKTVVGIPYLFKDKIDEGDEKIILDLSSDYLHESPAIIPIEQVTPIKSVSKIYRKKTDEDGEFLRMMFSDSPVYENAKTLKKVADEEIKSHKRRKESHEIKPDKVMKEVTCVVQKGFKAIEKQTKRVTGQKLCAMRVFMIAYKIDGSPLSQNNESDPLGECFGCQ